MQTRDRKIIHRETWKGHFVEIQDEANFRSLYFDSHHLQSRLSLTAPHELVLSYTAIMASCLLINSNPKSILMVGLGSGSFVRFFHHHLPQSRIDSVDSSQHVIDIARGYFQLPENDFVKVYCMDGFDFISKNKDSQYDLILIDAFDAKGMAPSIYSELFFKNCGKILAPGGVISCNLWSGKKERLKEIKNYLQTNFQGQLYLPVPERGNLVVLAMLFPLPWETLNPGKKKLRALSRTFGLNFRHMVKIARQNNLSFGQRFRRMLTS